MYSIRTGKGRGLPQRCARGEVRREAVWHEQHTRRAPGVIGLRHRISMSVLLFELFLVAWKSASCFPLGEVPRGTPSVVHRHLLVHVVFYRFFSKNSRHAAPSNYRLAKPSGRYLGREHPGERSRPTREQSPGGAKRLIVY